MAKPRGETFECVCGNVQPLSKASVRSITCIKCETVYAIVADDEGNKATVPFFHQKNQGE